MKAYEEPTIALSNGSSHLLIFHKGKFELKEIPVFLDVKSISVMDENLILISDEHTAFLWNLIENKCKLAFTSSNTILSVHTTIDSVFVLTTNEFQIISNGKVSSYPLTVPLNCKLVRSADLSSFYIVCKDEIIPLIIDDGEISLKQNIPLPPGCICIAPIGSKGRSLYAVFDAKERHVKSLRQHTSSGWSDSMEIPMITALIGGSVYAIALCQQYALIVHQIPEVFETFNEPDFTIKTIVAAGRGIDEKSLISILQLTFGLHEVASFLLKNKSTRLIPAALGELWRRKLFGLWSALALKFPECLAGTDASRNIMSLKDMPLDQLAPFAAILEASGSIGDALRLYIKAGAAPSVVQMLSEAPEIAYEHGEDLVRMAIRSLKDGDKSTASRLFSFLSEGIEKVPPKRVLPLLAFDWTALEMYYRAFEQSKVPSDVANAYACGLAANRPNEVVEFTESGLCDPGAAMGALLRLGKLDEYGKLLSRVDPQKYVQFLVLRREFGKLREMIKENNELLTSALEIASHDEAFFCEIADHYDELGVDICTLIASIPKTVPAKCLAKGFELIGTKVTATISAEKTAEEICREESFKIFSKRMSARRTATIINI